MASVMFRVMGGASVMFKVMGWGLGEVSHVMFKVMRGGEWRQSCSS